MEKVGGQLYAPAALPTHTETRVPVGFGGWVGPRVGLDVSGEQIFL